MCDKNKLFAVLKYNVNCLLGTCYLKYKYFYEVLKYNVNCLLGTCYLKYKYFYEDYQMKLLNINDFERCSCTCNVNDINDIKVCFWKQTIYVDTCLKPQTSCWQFRVTVYIIWTLFLNVTILF